MSSEEEEDLSRRNVRSNYFQTEFTVSVKKGRDTDRSNNPPTGCEDDRKKVSISIQTGNRSMVGAEESPKERKRWVRPPLVGQASSGSDSQISIVPVLEGTDESDDDIIDSSQEPFVSTTNYPNRKDYISEKPPEGSSSGVHENRVPSPSSASSLTSGRPLEWDSGADVGYFKAYQAGSAADKLSSLELMALGGSASLLTRSDPEGTVSNPAPPPPAIPSSNNNLNQNQSVGQTSIGPPNAESTPFQSSSKSSRSGSQNGESGVASHLFPEVIIRTNEQPSDSDHDNRTSKQSSLKPDDGPKRSSSLEDVVVTSQPPAPFVRSQSQNSINFDMNAHLIKLVQPQSNSSSSVATVVKGSMKAQTSDKKESESGSGADGRAHSFEYLPGAAYENAQRDTPPETTDPLRKDIERGVKLLSDFVKGSNANNTIMKKKLLKKVVNELLCNKYPGEESWSSAGSTHGQGSGDWLHGTSSIPNPPSTWQGLPSAPEGAEKPEKPRPVSSWPLNIGGDRCVTRRGHSKELERSEISGESGSQASLMARMDKDAKPAGTSCSTLNSSSVTESSIKQHKQPLPGIRKRMFEPKHPVPGKSAPSSSSTSSDWKAAVTKSEKIREQLNQKELQKEPLKVVDPSILNFLHCERENQLDWIKKEIDHLSNLKRLLEMHESLKKNFDHLKKTKDSKKGRSQSAEYKATRPTRKSAHVVRSEPLNSHMNNSEQSSENGWDSHDYGGSRRGVLKKNASTNTFATEKPDVVETVKKPVSYTILFDARMGKENLRSPLSSRVNTSNRISAKTSGMTIVDRETLMRESRERIKVQLYGSLQEELISKKPDCVARAEMRRQTVADIAAMREVRGKNRNKILTAMANGEPAPQIPNPLAVKRVVSQKAMRKLTEKNYRKSSLVKKQARERKKKEEMVTNRLMADMFNRNLQRRTLRGETYLSNSVNVL